MPVDTAVATEIWTRYQYIRDNGHLDYVLKARRCEDFFAGLQWDANDLALLKQARRPALTINKIISTISNVLGEQIFNRTQIGFRPRNEGATRDVADALSKVFSQVSDNNQLEWARSDMFADGIITSRGFLDVRLDFSDSLRGEVRIEQLNPKNVLVDPDAEEYDPDAWGDVFVTKWMSPDMIEALYNKQDAEALRGTQESFWPYGYDSLDRDRDRFGNPRSVTYGLGMVAFQPMVRNVRVIERQHRRLDNMEHFADLRLGDIRPVPTSWDRDQISLYLQENSDVTVIKKRVPRVRWTVVADKFVLHDDWSPYQHFTVVPYFPFFRRGRTMGLVESLLGPQELLNKVSSQELHVVNTTANSGWKIKANALKNMSVGELESRGAQTGLVLELDDINSAEKIQPNQTPTGLDRISYKAEESIKTISGVSDYRTGNAREDVAAKAVKANQAASSANTAKIMDNLRRTDYILARNVLDLVQEFYSEPRVVTIVTDRLTQATEQLEVNTPDASGRIQLDLTLGEYAVVVTTQPERDNFEDSQFQQALQLRVEAGVQLPDKYLIMASRLKDKADIVNDMAAESQTPEAEAEKAMAQREREAAVGKLEAEVMQKQADAQQKAAKAQAEAAGGEDAAATAQMEFDLKRWQLEQEFALKREEAERAHQLEQIKLNNELELAREKQAAELAMKRELNAAQTHATQINAAAAAKLADARSKASSSSTTPSTGESDVPAA